jgi:hypothetical protein
MPIWRTQGGAKGRTSAVSRRLYGALEDGAQRAKVLASNIARGTLDVVGNCGQQSDNRSILCDPRRADMKAVLNAKIKRRESFRPFAPSILAEHSGDWFEEDDAVPFMTQVFQIRPEKRLLIPAVCHVDGSGRLQTVSRRANALYYRLIETFAALTGVPMLLNTSFNENEPIVCRPREALDCFLRTEMDALALEPFLVERPPRQSRVSAR